MITAYHRLLRRTPTTKIQCFYVILVLLRETLPHNLHRHTSHNGTQYSILFQKLKKKTRIFLRMAAVILEFRNQSMMSHDVCCYYSNEFIRCTKDQAAKYGHSSLLAVPNIVILKEANKNFFRYIF